MEKVKTIIEKEYREGKIYLTAPYSKSFISKIRKIGGNWNGKQWVIDSNQESILNDKLYYEYGTDGERIADICEIKVYLDKVYSGVVNCGVNVVLFGETIASLRDKRSKLYLNDINILEGDITGGGSSKYPSIYFDEVTFIMLNFPANKLSHSTVKKAIKEGWVEVLNNYERKRKIETFLTQSENESHCFEEQLNEVA